MSLAHWQNLHTYIFFPLSLLGFKDRDDSQDDGYSVGNETIFSSFTLWWHKNIKLFEGWCPVNSKKWTDDKKYLKSLWGSNGHLTQPEVPFGQLSSYWKICKGAACRWRCVAQWSDRCVPNLKVLGSNPGQGMVRAYGQGMGGFSEQRKNIWTNSI